MPESDFRELTMAEVLSPELAQLFKKLGMPEDYSVVRRKSMLLAATALFPDGWLPKTPGEWKLFDGTYGQLVDSFQLKFHKEEALGY